MNLGDPASLLGFFVRKWGGGGLWEGRGWKSGMFEYYGGSGSVSRMQGFGFRILGLSWRVLDLAFRV